MSDIAKLPKWAQARLSSLEHDVARMEALLSGGPEDTNTVVANFPGPDQPLAPNARVRFRLGPCDVNHWIECRVDRDGRLDVTGGRPLVIHPAASNHVTLGLSD